MAALALAEPHHLVPADGDHTVVVDAEVRVTGRASARGRRVELRALGRSVEAFAVPASQSVPGHGLLSFEVSSTRPGPVTFGLFDVEGWSGRQPLATVEVEFTRKVVVLAAGFQSALARRYLTFGEPVACGRPADPGSINEALICLGFEPETTIVDMAWEAAPCRPEDGRGESPSLDCVATIRANGDGRDVIWQPADYDLADLGLSLLRQRQVDLWAHRLAQTMVTYNEELERATGQRASFYLVGHSLGGQVVVRALRAILDDADLRVHFEGPNRGVLPAVVSIDGALNWAGTVELIGEPRCGFPVRTVPDETRARDNADAVERAHEALGTLTVAMTSATDPIVKPDVALLRSPRPSRGYLEELHHLDAADDGCSHSALLWPEPTGYPLRAVLEEHVGRSAGD